MKKDVHEKIQQEVDEIISQLTQQGFAVRQSPTANQLPPQLGNIQPDLLACSENENLVIEFIYGENEEKLAKIESLFSSISNLKNWDLRIVHIPRKQGHVKRKPIDIDSITKRIAVAQRVTYEEKDMVGYLVLWTALEALLKRVLDLYYSPFEPSEKTKSGRPYLNTLLKEAYSVGLINKKEMDDLQRLVKLRTSLVHGEAIPYYRVVLFTKVEKVAGRLLAEINNWSE